MSTGAWALFLCLVTELVSCEQRTASADNIPAFETTDTLLDEEVPSGCPWTWIRDSDYQCRQDHVEPLISSYCRGLQPEFLIEILRRTIASDVADEETLARYGVLGTLDKGDEALLSKTIDDHYWQYLVELYAHEVHGSESPLTDDVYRTIKKAIVAANPDYLPPLLIYNHDAAVINITMTRRAISTRSQMIVNRLTRINISPSGIHSVTLRSARDGAIADDCDKQVKSFAERFSADLRNEIDFWCKAYLNSQNPDFWAH